MDRAFGRLIFAACFVMAGGCRSQLRTVEIENSTPWGIHVEIDSKEFRELINPGKVTRLLKKVFRGGAMRILGRRQADHKIVYSRNFYSDDLNRVDDGEKLVIKITAESQEED